MPNVSSLSDAPITLQDLVSALRGLALTPSPPSNVTQPAEIESRVQAAIGDASNESVLAWISAANQGDQTAKACLSRYQELLSRSSQVGFSALTSAGLPVT